MVDRILAEIGLLVADTGRLARAVLAVAGRFLGGSLGGPLSAPRGLKAPLELSTGKPMSDGIPISNGLPISNGTPMSNGTLMSNGTPMSKGTRSRHLKEGGRGPEEHGSECT